MLAAKRKEHETRLAAYRELEPALATERYMRATLRFGLRYEQAMLDWLAELEDDLAQEGPGGA
jgi:hypothetical protein